jgi:hypothetical protein
VNAKGIIRRFINELRRSNPSRRIIWITPPSSSKYTLKTHQAIDQWINQSARALGFSVISSRQITGNYIKGKTGSDGVHYFKPAADQWALRCYRKITPIDDAY